ncbi:MAG TPA: twin-arginine translocase TatA/TatE family subunit [Solirubrobacteraceae bacterium]|jgi:sec-independent protein translocase protein TatA|nr:twin-arginine translocase TatA/TatE family subunit [Solirubrobacteraceae bacterium]
MGLDNPLHIAFLLILLLLVFGAKRLPEMGRSLGSGMRGFKDTLSGEHTHTPLVAAQEAAVPGAAAPAPAAAREPVVAAAVHETGAPVA